LGDSLKKKFLKQTQGVTLGEGHKGKEGKGNFYGEKGSLRHFRTVPRKQREPKTQNVTIEKTGEQKTCSREEKEKGSDSIVTKGGGGILTCHEFKRGGGGTIHRVKGGG